MTPKKIPLGYIELDNGIKAITAMNDLFLSHMFNNPENWEALRDSVNIILDKYKQINPDTTVTLVTGKIIVETQYKYLMSVDNTTKDQDIKMAAESDLTYIEFQNRTKTNPPLETRSVEYFGLGVGHSKGKTANQIWLLAEDLESVLHGKIFARYILKDETTGEPHPGGSGILYVNLSKLAEEKCPAGELSGFLLGTVTDPQNEKVKEIAKRFNAGFETFKADKEAIKMMSLRERAKNEGWIEGLEEGEARGEIKGSIATVNELLELVKLGFSLEEASQKIMSKYTLQEEN